ncbi:hypothetical protein J6590_028653 [Homalodisca vitripennis]|nr:hypothetical protein J6590_028653 [Homalodisca vitripennis]
MLDYSQAFASSNHDMLLAKMNYHGFFEEAVMWIRSYLGDRKQAIKLGNDTSEWLPKLRGVPQEDLATDLRREALIPGGGLRTHHPTEP